MNTFPQTERLCGKMAVEQLYRQGQRFTAWPLRVTYLPLPVAEGEKGTSEVLVWAPKSLFKHAVDRNRLRRLMREAWRLGERPLRPCRVAFNYMDKQIASLDTIRHAMAKAIRKLNERMQDGE